MAEQALIPSSCYKTKCMRRGCTELAAHKVCEENPWKVTDPLERLQHVAFNISHHRTTYLCNTHFTELIDREENYMVEDDRFDKDDARLT